MPSAERGSVQGLTLHRSDVIAHTADFLDSRGSQRAGLRARGRREGFASKPNYPFKPLGAVLKTEHIAEMNATGLAQWDKDGLATAITAQSGTLASAAPEAKAKRSDRDRTAEWAQGGPAAARSLSATAGHEGTDAELGWLSEKQDRGCGEAERKLQVLPAAVLLRDVPRCLRHRGRHVTDGFNMLRTSIQDSEQRRQLVKCSGSSGAAPRGPVPPLRLPDRHAASSQPPACPRRVQTARANTRSSAGTPGGVEEAPLSGNSGPLTARVPMQHTSAAKSPRRQRAAAHAGLPSLADVVASSGQAAGHSGSRAARGEVARLREAINELLGLPRSTALKPSQEEVAGARRGRADIRRKMERQLDSAWADRALWDRCAVTPKDIEELRKACQDDEAKLTTLERFWRDLVPFQDDARGPGGRTAAVALDLAGSHASGFPEWLADGPRYLKAEINSDVLDGLREDLHKGPVGARDSHPGGGDPVEPPVTRLREALLAYQAVRDERCSTLQGQLDSMAVDRPKIMARRASTVGRAAESATEERWQKQQAWYRELLQLVQTDKRNMPNVAYFIFDFIKQVLECGEEFRKEMYFAMLERVESFEYTKPVATVVVNMIRGIEDLSEQDLMLWCRQNYKEVPKHIQELVEVAPAATSGIGDTQRGPFITFAAAT